MLESNVTYVPNDYKNVVGISCSSSISTYKSYIYIYIYILYTSDQTKPSVLVTLAASKRADEVRSMTIGLTIIAILFVITVVIVVW